MAGKGDLTCVFVVGGVVRLVVFDGTGLRCRELLVFDFFELDHDSSWCVQLSHELRRADAAVSRLCDALRWWCAGLGIVAELC